MKKYFICVLTICAGALFSATAYAENYVITIKDNQFSPKDLIIPVGQKVKVTVKNLDQTPAEFESHDLNREKVVSANSEVIVFIGPLDSGSYEYFDDFHRDTTKGTITAK